MSMYQAVRNYNASHPRDGLKRTGTGSARGIQRSSTIPVEIGLPAAVASVRRSLVHAAKAEAAPAAPPIRPCSTMPDNPSDPAPEIRRTGSGGFAFLRRRSAEEQEKISRARAQELSVLYELSDVKAEGLNREAHLKRPVRQAPSLGASMCSLQQAAAAYSSAKIAAIEEAKTDPLLTKHERVERLQQEREFEQQHTNKSGGSHRTKSLRIDADLPEDMGMEVSYIDGSHADTPVSVEETVAMTPSPAYGSLYHASNGHSYWVKNLC